MYGTAEASELPRHAVQREDILGYIDSEKHRRHGYILTESGRGLRFCRLIVRAGQARHLLEESFVPRVVRGDGPLIC